MANSPIYRLPPHRLERVATTALSEIANPGEALIGLPEAWKQSRGKGVKVCVLDTGVDKAHPDLQGAIQAVNDFTGSRSGAHDRHGHGTWTAGAIGARINTIGIHGIAPECDLYCAKVLGDDGGGTDEAIAEGIAWGAVQGCTVFSLSLGGPMPMPRVVNELQQLPAGSRFFFAAAGNDGGRVNYPAAHDEFVSVGACDDQGRLANFTSHIGRLDIVGPGVDMLGCAPGGGYAKMSGTSMATPIVAAVGALAIAKHDAAGGATDLRTVADMREHLQKTAVDKGEFRLLNARKLLEETHGEAPSQAPIGLTRLGAIMGYEIWYRRLVA